MYNFKCLMYIIIYRFSVFIFFFVIKVGIIKFWKIVLFWGIYVLGKFLSCMIYFVMSVVIEYRVEGFVVYIVK